MGHSQRAIGCVIAGLVYMPILVGSAIGAESAASIPDFSGPWGRTSLDYEPPPSGPGPVTNTKHRLDMLVGDYKNPILLPWAAEEVRKRAEISLRGDDYPTPSSQCYPEPPPYILRNTEMHPGVFTMPWTAFVTYRHAQPWQERVCAENPHEYYAGKDTAIPQAAKPDF